MAEADSGRRSRITLIAVDQSEWSEQAFEWFMENIYLEGDQVILLSVVEQLHLPFLADAVVIEEWKNEVHKMEEELKALERKYIDRCSDLRTPIRFRVEQGKPGEKICEIALKEKATLIVLGSRGSGLIRRTVLGSVSNYVIHHTKIPVILCPKDYL
ncbi:universal stress protein Slr1101-like [Pocillopora verrucosa]|uniref:UspA domain-containing protein n=1 Tax=Pocillopora damicornis TaxID=46731 RepID=A0A3M6TDM9_POCDA|nr:uncharacterized protein LOC113679065 [Pocillopora damicornis]XP_058971627.1 universal stress protein Slr1101-like [Pocillopora verrucosa]RMX39480.1 hypothetical protein pdam_00015586 [Pocillopora damicornis]